MENNNQNHKKKNKYYYKYHNNHAYYNKKNKQYYYKNKNKNKQKEQVIQESNQINNNILLEQNNEIQEEQAVIQENNVIENKIIDIEPEIAKKTEEEQKQNIVEVINENNNFDEFEFRPIKKDEKGGVPSINGLFKYALGFLLLVIVVFGVSYSYFTYRGEDSRQADIATGEVYVSLDGQTVNLSLNKMYPRTTTEARSRSDNYIDFTIKAKNTSTTKPLYYKINLLNGADVSGKTRISPRYLIVDLEEKVGNTYTYVQEAISMGEFSFEDVIPINTTSEVTKDYRIRIWVSDEILISDTEPNATYTQSEFNNLYGNVVVSINSFDKKTRKTASETLLRNIDEFDQFYSLSSTWTDTDNTVYFSGNNSNAGFNYVWYSGKLWRIVAIYLDGKIKMVTENTMSGMKFDANNSNAFYTDANNHSYVYDWLNEYFYDTLYNADNIIATADWNATETSTASTKPANTTMVTAKVGLLNAYEYYNSYRNASNCSNGYLAINAEWYLINPKDSTSLWYVEYNGDNIDYDYSHPLSIRPAVVLKSDVVFDGGDGTYNNPYTIDGDKEKAKANVSLINSRLSGEYVKLVSGNNEDLFKIVSVEDGKTKLLSTTYADGGHARVFSPINGPTNTSWGSGHTTDADTWYTYLTGTYYPNLVNTYGPLFDKGVYHLSVVGYDYHNRLCTDPIPGPGNDCAKEFTVGLLGYGEMFATSTNSSQKEYYINKQTTGIIWTSIYGFYIGYNPTYEFIARPTVHLKSSVVIKSGSGTYNDPYIVGL